MRRPGPARSASTPDRLRDHGGWKLAARKSVGELPDTDPATLRNWIEAEERAGAPMRPTGSDDSVDIAEVLRLRQKVAEL
jgi:hypothetical protein